MCTEELIEQLVEQAEMLEGGQSSGDEGQTGANEDQETTSSEHNSETGSHPDGNQLKKVVKKVHT